MKRIFLAAIISAAAYTVSAQEELTYKTPSGDMDYSTQVPVSIRTHFQANNPNVTATWTPMTSDWWYATYKTDKNRIVRVYYNTQIWSMERNENFKTSFPIFNTFVPEAVITSAINSYGNNLYSITMRKPGPNNEEMYHVTVIKNGVSDIVSMNSQGVVYTDTKKL